jgi:hypothetical protein
MEKPKEQEAEQTTVKQKFKYVDRTKWNEKMKPGVKVPEHEIVDGMTGEEVKVKSEDWMGPTLGEVEEEVSI